MFLLEHISDCRLQTVHGSLDDTHTGILLMKQRNKIGPSIEPWGMPEQTGAEGDNSQSTTTRRLRSSDPVHCVT